MELRQLRTFVAVSELGSLLKASARLHVAQPALGQQIAALEAELGARLFERSSRGMALTEAGRSFLAHAQVVLADVERARGAVRGAAGQPQGEVAIGLPNTIALSATVPLVQACRAQWPGVQLKVVEAYSGFLREWLLAGRLDLAMLFGEGHDPGLHKRVLLDEQLALVAGPAGPGAPALPRSLTLARAAREPLVLPGREHGLRRIIDEACAPLGLQLQVVAEIDSLPSVKKAVEAGVGCTILPLASVGEEVRQGRLQAATLQGRAMLRRLVCATAVTRPGTAAGAAVTALAIDVIRQMVQQGAWPARWLGGPPG